MSEWKEYKLGDLIETNALSINKNYPYTNILYLDTGSITCNKIESYQCFDINNAPSRAKRIVSDEDIIYSLVRPNQLHYGFIKSPQKNLVVSTGFVTITCKKELLYPKFLYYYLTQNFITEYLHTIAEASTSAYPSLKPSDIESLEIEIPSLSEQKHIASILGSLDDKIDLLHRENETLEAMAETLFRKWFIENTESSVKQGYLGDYILDTIGGEWGKEVSQDDFVKPVKCIRGTDIAALNTGIPSKTPLRFIKKSKYEKIKPLDGDIIIEISGGTENQSTGRSLYINKEVCGLFDYPIIFSNFCRLLRVEKKYSYFVYCYLQYLYRQDEFFNIENGSSGIKNLDYKTLLYNNQYQMPTNKNFAANFSEIVTPYFTKIDKNKLQICNLMKMRETLLPRLMLNCKK